MVALRSRRLETILGGPLGTVGYDKVAGIIATSPPEAQDLDYKAELYGNGDSARRDLAGDVAALANSTGGLIILGIEEDDQARAVAVPGVPVSDAEELRIRQIVAGNTAPVPRFDVLTLEDATRRGHGLVLIAVPPSVMSPHAVIVNSGLRYPRRTGTTTVYLSEHEVDAAYRTRHASLGSAEERLEEVEQSILPWLDNAKDSYVIVSLLPDLPGDYRITAEEMRKFDRELYSVDPLIFPMGRSFLRTAVRRRHLVTLGFGAGQQTSTLAATLYGSGAGSFAAAVTSSSSYYRQGEAADDHHVANGLISGLRFLGRHARDRAMTGGPAVARVSLWPVSQTRPMRLVPSAGFDSRDLTGLLTTPWGTALVDIDEIAEDGPGFVRAAHYLGNDLWQEFGEPEVPQFTADGSLRLPHLRQGQVLKGWASIAGVEVLNEILG